jgi:hypothetical protein
MNSKLNIIYSMFTGITQGTGIAGSGSVWFWPGRRMPAQKADGLYEGNPCRYKVVS